LFKPNTTSETGKSFEIFLWLAGFIPIGLLMMRLPKFVPPQSPHSTGRHIEVKGEGVKPGILNCNCGTLVKADQFGQAFHPELDGAKQLGREIFRPQLALAQIFPLLRRRVRRTVSPYDPPQCN
jgi:hypothetical protein